MALLLLLICFIFLFCFFRWLADDSAYQVDSMPRRKATSRIRKSPTIREIKNQNPQFETLGNQNSPQDVNNQFDSFRTTFDVEKGSGKLNFIATVNDDCKLEIGKEYLDLLNLKSGDQFEMKLGGKGIRLLKVESAENNDLSLKKQLSTLSHWSLSKAVDFQKLVDNSIGSMTLDQRSKMLLNNACDLLIKDKPEMANILMKTSTLLSQASISFSQFQRELINTSNSDVILIMSLIRVPDRIRNMRYEEEFKNDYMGFLVTAEIQNLLIWNVLMASNIVNEDWKSVRAANNVKLGINIEGKEQEFLDGFSSFISTDNQEFWEKVYYPLMYLIQLELILKKSPSPLGLMNAVDKVMPSVIANLVGPNPADAFQMMEPLRNKMDELGVKGI